MVNYIYAKKEVMMLGKSLAHVEKIVDVYPVEGANTIEMVQVLDYHVAVKKGEFKIGDRALYIEIDSRVPDGMPAEYTDEARDLISEWHKANKEDRPAIQEKIDELAKHNTIPEFEFLRRRGFKVKQIKFGSLGIYSQGILFKLDVISGADLSDAPVGYDATTELGIEQIIEDIEESGANDVTKLNKFLDNTPIVRTVNKKLMRYKWYRDFRAKLRKPAGKWDSAFPSKSDEENIQKIFTKMKTLYGDREWYVTEKLEGQNISITSKRTKVFSWLEMQHVGVCTHHRFLPSYDGSGFWKTVRRLGIDDEMRKVKGSWFIRGEHVGGKIQGNIYKFNETDIYVFEVYDIETGKFLPLDDAIKFTEDRGMKFVPVLDRAFKLPETVTELLDYSNGYSVFGNKVRREGVVIRLADDPTVSFKVRSPVYLDKQG